MDGDRPEPALRAPSAAPQSPQPPAGDVPAHPAASPHPPRLPWLFGALLVTLAVLAFSPSARHALGLGGHSRATPPVTPAADQAHVADVIPHNPGARPHLTTFGGPDDPWLPYIAGEETCPGAARIDLPIAEQNQVMVCLIDWARERAGLTPPPTAALLASTAQQKALEIVRCGVFTHAACDRPPDADVRTAGYHGTFGENLYIASGKLGSPRAALDGWLNSPGHRENLFRAEWRTQGVALVKLAQFGQYRDMSLWVSQFGSD